MRACLYRVIWKTTLRPRYHLLAILRSALFYHQNRGIVFGMFILIILVIILDFGQLHDVIDVDLDKSEQRNNVSTPLDCYSQLDDVEQPGW